MRLREANDLAGLVKLVQAHKVKLHWNSELPNAHPLHVNNAEVAELNSSEEYVVVYVEE